MTISAWAVDELTGDAQLLRQAMGSVIGSAGGILATAGSN